MDKNRIGRALNRSFRQLRERVLPQCYIDVADNSTHCDEGISGREIARYVHESTPLAESTDVGRKEGLITAMWTILPLGVMELGGTAEIRVLMITSDEERGGPSGCKSWSYRYL